MVVDTPQLAPLYAGPTMSPECAAQLAAKAEQADAERAACEAREADILARSAAIAGSLDDLREVGGVPGCVARWERRNRDLLQAIAADPSQCCGEWRREGYYGWCSLIGKPAYFREIGRDHENRPILERCGRCPVAMARERSANESEAWIESFFSFLEALEHGDSPFADVRS